MAGLNYNDRLEHLLTEFITEGRNRLITRLTKFVGQYDVEDCMRGQKEEHKRISSWIESSITNLIGPEEYKKELIETEKNLSNYDL